MKIGESMAYRLRSEDSFSRDGVRSPEDGGAVTGMHPVLDLSDHSAAKRPTISVIICTRNRPDALRQCLRHVSELKPSADEVLVVDNSSGDEEIEVLAKEAGARYVVEQRPGLSRARNAGLSESRCEIAAFLDDDCIPDPEWLANLLLPFSDPQVAAVTGEIVRYAGESPELSASPMGSGELRYVSQDTRRWFEMASFGGLGSGGNMAFRRSACPDVALFDERLGRGAPLWMAEENCAFVSLLSRGHAAVRIPGARVYHPAKPKNAHQEATSTIAYWLLLFADFPENRLDLIHFLVRRIFRRPVAWRLNSSHSFYTSGIVHSTWGAKLKATCSGVALFLRAKGLRSDEKRNTGIAVLRLISRRPVQSNSAAAP